MLADAVLAAERDAVTLLSGGFAADDMDGFPEGRGDAATVEKMAMRRRNDEERMYALGYETLWMPGETKTRVSDKQKAMYTKTYIPEGDTSGVVVGDHTFNKKDILRKRRMGPGSTPLPEDPGRHPKMARPEPLPPGMPEAATGSWSAGSAPAPGGLLCDEGSLEAEVVGLSRMPGPSPPPLRLAWPVVQRRAGPATFPAICRRPRRRGSHIGR